MDAPAPCTAGGPIVVSLPTDDGVVLQADFFPIGAANAPAVVLLHMIPPQNTRKNWPQAFIEAVVAKGIAVLNVDRRGAGGSTGVAQDAYIGPKGKLDAKAAVDFLASRPCAIRMDRVAIAGASNGTTTVLDFTVSSQQKPRAIVFMTGGSYTENQTSVAANRATLDPISILFVFSTQERAWSAAFAPGPGPWQFKEYDPGDHGTRMFAARPESVADVASFLASSLAN